MAITTNLTKIRRYLRDPDGDIWSDADLLRFWNDSEQDLAQKTKCLSDVQAYRYPPEYNYCICYDWQREYVEGDIYAPFIPWQSRDGVMVTAPWMVGYWQDNNEPDQSNYVVTSPWMIEYAAPATTVDVPLHYRTDRILAMFWDNEVISPLDEGQIARTDPSYKTTAGTPTHYYRPDDYQNTFVPYPRPSSITHDEHDFSEILEDNGTIITYSDDWLQLGDTGLITDVVNSDGAFLAVLDISPRELLATTDDSDFPAWLQKYIEYGVLERAYGADTDGFIPSLRDYWRGRRDAGVKAILRAIRMRSGADKTVTMGTWPRRERVMHPRLPSTYADF